LGNKIERLSLENERYIADIELLEEKVNYMENCIIPQRNEEKKWLE
jgi:hypothetical protein